MPLVPRYLNLKVRCNAEAHAIEVPHHPARSENSLAKTTAKVPGGKASGSSLFSSAFTMLYQKGSLLLLMLAVSGLTASAGGVRLRDLVMVSGARDNQLVGYGLVVGLAGDGDKDPVYTKQTVANMLQRYGINVAPTTLSSKNVAVVMVTADIPAFIKSGGRIDVQVASMGDAKSLQGGVLLQTPLLGADNKVYAVAQGPISVGGFSAGAGGGGGATVTKNHPTVAQIIGGAIVEREIPTQIVRDNSIELLLREPSFTSASRMAAAINETFTNSAHAVDATSVRVNVPADEETTPIDFIARLENLEMNPEIPARIIINERTGTIVATSRIRVSSCAVSHGNITINVASTLDVSQPNPFSNTGTTVVTPRTTTEVTETKSSLVPLPEMPTVEKVASALNSLGVTPRDVMAIFQAMKQAGALQAELIIR
ncbi:MAG TPA: flagellar basal body P-ring protein FlgI [Candidatus Paceibacterota bacterium]|nr:flagellar basal body P-ring protein FlgI [Candidatus Paceibacterota bacterium]